MRAQEEKENPMDYTLFGDNTMNIMVDGKVQRRRYSVNVDCSERGTKPFANTIEPELHEGEEVLRTIGGGMCIITTSTPPTQVQDVAEAELARLRLLKEAEVKQAADNLRDHMGSGAFIVPMHPGVFVVWGTRESIESLLRIQTS